MASVMPRPVRFAPSRPHPPLHGISFLSSLWPRTAPGLCFPFSVAFMEGHIVHSAVEAYRVNSVTALPDSPLGIVVFEHSSLRPHAAVW